MDEAYETARRILTEHMAELHKVSAVLMEREKISGEEFKTLMEGGTLPPYDLANGKTAEPAKHLPSRPNSRNPIRMPSRLRTSRRATVKVGVNHGSEFFP